MLGKIFKRSIDGPLVSKPSQAVTVKIKGFDPDDDNGLFDLFGV